MADDTFRPRKPINPSEVEPNNELQEVEKVRNMAEMSDSGVKISGNPPEALKRMLEARQIAQSVNETPTSNEASPPRLSNSELRVTGSSKLEQLLAGIQSTTYHYHEVKLPSLGKFYDGEDGPQDGVLHIRPMTGEEEQILATPRLVRRGQAINMIFDRCMQEKSYRSDAFLTPDRTFLLIFLRGLSYTKNYDVEIKCPECNTKFATVIDLDRDVKVDACPADFNYNALVGTLPTTGYHFRYRISRGIDEQQIQDYRERRLKGFDVAGQADDTLLYRTAMLLEDIEGLTDKTEMQLLLKRLPINDVAHLRNVVNNQPFGVDTNVGISCPSCFADFSVDLPLEANFFFPRARKETHHTTHA